MKLERKRLLRQKRVWRIRRKISGDASRPRVCLHFSNKHIFVQAIDDDAGRTLVSLSTLNKDLRTMNLKAGVKGASEIGRLFSEKAKEAGIKRIVFDRNGRLYHGAVKAFAEASREAGLDF